MIIINCLIIIHLSFPENLLSWSILYDAIDIFDFTCFIIYVSERILGIVSLCLDLLNQKLACLLAISAWSPFKSFARSEKVR